MVAILQDSGRSNPPPLGANFVAIPFNSTNNLHPRITEKHTYRNLKEVTKMDYTHSRVDTTTGARGKIAIKLVNNINTAS